MVRPSGPLRGTVSAGGAKNSALKLMAACLLAEGCTVLSNVPRISDVDTMSDVLRGIGARVERLDNGDVSVTTPPEGELVPSGPYELFERMRASVVVLGLLLARCGSVRVPLPGGDDFGDRPIDFHLSGLTAMGARFESSHGEVRGTVPGGRLVGTRVVLEYPSHTATDNLLMAAVLAKGTTVIENAAKEPEVADLASMLRDMGAVVRGAGTSRIEIEGVEVAPAGSSRGRPRPGGRRDLPGRRRDGGRRGHHRRRPARAHGDAPAQGQPNGRGDGHGPERTAGQRATSGCWRPTWRRSRTPESRPITARCS